MNNDNDNDNHIVVDSDHIPKKLVWEDGQQVMRPDLEAVAQGLPGALQSYFVPKTIDDYDVISETDEIQFSKLKTDDQKYDMVKGMIIGAQEKTDPPFVVSESRYVDGEFRSLKMILEDLISQNKVWLDPKDGNLYEYGYAIERKMIKFPCRHCSKILFSDEERTRHTYSHMARAIK